MTILLLVFLFVRPFVSSLAYPFLDHILLAFLLIFALAWLIRNRASLSGEQVKPLVLAAACYCVFILASFLVKGPTVQGAYEALTLCGGPLLMLVVMTLPEDRKRSVTLALVLGVLAVSMAVLYQYLWGFSNVARYLATHPSDAFIRDYVTRRRVFFPFVTPNLLGGYLAMMLPLTLLDKQTRWFCVPAGICLLLTRSLGAVGAAVAGLIAFAALSKGKSRAKALWLLAGLGACAAVIFIIRSAGATHTAPAFSALMRAEYWGQTLKIFASHPVFGVGPGKFNLINSRYAHNSYLQLAAETGIIALAAFMWLAFTGLRRLVKTAGPDKTRVLLVASAVIFLTHNLIDFSFFLPEISLLWWAVLGL